MCTPCSKFSTLEHILVGSSGDQSEIFLECLRMLFMNTHVQNIFSIREGDNNLTSCKKKNQMFLVSVVSGTVRNCERAGGGGCFCL